MMNWGGLGRMNRGGILLIISILLLNVLFLLPSLLYTPVKALDYGMETNLESVNASFWGEDEWAHSGYSVASAGDVNGDGYDDILIGAYNDCDGGDWAGQTYLIFGKASGWSMDTDLSASDASFLGEDGNDYSGYSVSGAGDVNGDGYDDILIGAIGNDEGGSNAGQTYLIFGKTSGWSMDIGLSASDASFWGEDAGDYSGWSVAGAGDVNGDGYNDILIGAPGKYDDDSRGQTYLILGKASGWSMDTNLSVSDASFRGEYKSDHSGRSVAGAGDVNGDGYDDILIGAPYNTDGSWNAGQTYLIFGKVYGWALDTNLSASDASFQGEDGSDYSGDSVSGAGDVNGDGYDDILIGVQNNDDGGNWAGQTYLIFGRTSSWAMDTALTDSDASFIGEQAEDGSGNSVSGAGDVNGDGYDDILIGACRYSDNGLWAGQTYLILGKPTGWEMGVNLSASLASFKGEVAQDHSGCSVASARDVNGDGYDDILVGADHNDDGGNIAGQTYLIFPDHNSEPTSITSVKAYSDDEYSNEISYREPGDRVYLELTAEDKDSRKNIAQVWIKGSSNPDQRFRLRLLESGENTGKFRGSITIANRTHSGYGWIDAKEGGWVEILSRNDPTILMNLSIESGIYLNPEPTNINLNEDEHYSLHFNTTGVIPETWTFQTNASWLNWGEFNNTLFGIPTNLHVGTYWANLRVEGYIYSDEINFTIHINNAPPQITTKNKLSIQQDKLYHIDYNSTDDHQGNITWHLITNATWLLINTTTGILNGTPTNEDIGIYPVNVSLSDGNNGWDYSEFTLRVKNVNDPPVLYDRNLTPSTIGTSTNFSFSIMYKDIDGDEPISIIVVFGSNWYPMINNDSIQSDFRNGVKYYCTLNLTLGIHNYYYSAFDGKSIVRFPQNEYLTIIVNDTEIDSDADGYNDTYERKMGSDPLNKNSTPLDWDGDGWNNTIETKSGSDPRNSSSILKDQDADGIPDHLDPDRDGDKVANVDDPYPDDSTRWEDDSVPDEEGDRAVFIWVGLMLFMFVVGVSVLVLHVVRKKRVEEEGRMENDDMGRIGKDE